MEWVIGSVVLLAGFFALVAALGILRLPDVLIRMHAATKVGVLSSGLTMLAVALYFGEVSVVVRCILIVLFLLLTAPIAGHMVGRAALRLGVHLYEPKK